MLASTARNWHSAGPHGLNFGSEAFTGYQGKAAYQHDGRQRASSSSAQSPGYLSARTSASVEPLCNSEYAQSTLVLLL